MFCESVNCWWWVSGIVLFKKYVWMDKCILIYYGVLRFDWSFGVFRDFCCRCSVFWYWNVGS